MIFVCWAYIPPFILFISSSRVFFFNSLIYTKHIHVFLNLICQYFMREFSTNIHEEYWPAIFCSYNIPIGFWYPGYADLVKNIGKVFPSFSIFWKILRLVLFLRDLKIITLTLNRYGLFRFSISFWVKFDKCTFQGPCLFSKSSNLLT